MAQSETVYPRLENKVKPLNYIFSKSALRSTLLIGKSLVKQPGGYRETHMSVSAFWKYQLDETANRFYSNHSYPADIIYH
jgi:hypothetical protein